MLRGIQPDNFFFLADTQSCQSLNDKESNRNGNRRHGHKSQQLKPQQLHSASIEQARQLITRTVGNGISRNRTGGKKSHRDGSPYSVKTVNCYCTYRVVNMQFIIQKPYSKYHQKSCHRTNHNRTCRIRHITGSRNRHQSGQRSVKAHGNIRFSVLNPGKAHAHHRGNSRRNGSRHEHGTQLLY